MIAPTETGYKWYLAIMKGCLYTSFTGVWNESYRNWKKNAESWGIKVPAEKFEVDNETMNLLTGFDKWGERVQEPEDSLLAKLVRRLNQGETMNIQDELDKLCSAA